MANQVSLWSAAALYDVITFIPSDGSAKITFATAVGVSIASIGNDLDVKKPKGADLAKISSHGKLPSKVSISLTLWDDVTFGAYRALLPYILAKPGKTTPQQLGVVYPTLVDHGLYLLLPAPFDVPEASNQQQKVKLTFYEYTPAPKTSSASPSKSASGTSDQDKAALDAEYADLEQQKLDAVRKGPPGVAQQTIKDINRKEDGLKKQYANPPPSLSNNKP